MLQFRTRCKQPTHLSSAPASESCFVAKQASSRKYAKYKQRCHNSNVEFVALAWESLGGATPEVHDLVNKLSHLEADRFQLKRNIVKSLLYARLSLSLQKNQAKMVQARMETLGLMSSVDYY